MALGRRLLGLLALASLALLVYGGVTLAFSVPVDERSAELNAAPHGGLPKGHRALVVPIVDPAVVPTFAQGGERFLGFAGVFLAHGEPASLPSGARNVTLARALVHVDDATLARMENETLLVNLTGVPLPHANSTDSTGNLTLDLAALAQGRPGFVVKPDHAENASFVPLDALVGEVVRVEPAGRALLLMGSSGAAFVAAVGALVATHKGARERGVAEGMCRECSAPLAREAPFCARCGAYPKEGHA